MSQKDIVFMFRNLGVAFFPSLWDFFFLFHFLLHLPFLSFFSLFPPPQGSFVWLGVNETQSPKGLVKLSLKLKTQEALMSTEQKGGYLLCFPPVDSSDFSLSTSSLPSELEEANYECRK